MKIIGFIAFTLILCSSLFAQEAQKIDETRILSCDYFLSRMDDLHFKLNENPNSSGYILVYEGKMKFYKEGKAYYVLPRFGEAKNFISTMKARIRFRDFPLDRSVFVNAGFREKFTIEFWLVPNGATPPKATPTLTKMGHRKGKPNRNCGEF